MESEGNRTRFEVTLHLYNTEKYFLMRYMFGIAIFIMATSIWAGLQRTCTRPRVPQGQEGGTARAEARIGAKT